MNSWTHQEDELLLHFYSQAESFKKWKQISDKFCTLGIQKTVYQCRQRYINKLDPMVKNDRWTKNQIQQIFLFYQIHGSKWQKMQSILSQRTQSQLKNKFYSFLRSFILKVLQQSKHLKSFTVNSISSKTIKRLFQGTQEFVSFSGKLASYLQIIDYEITTEGIQQLLRQKDFEIKHIMKKLFENTKKSEVKQTVESEINAHLENDPENQSQKMEIKSKKHSEEENHLDDHSQNKQILSEIQENNNQFQRNIGVQQNTKHQIRFQERQPLSYHQYTNLWSLGPYFNSNFVQSAINFQENSYSRSRLEGDPCSMPYPLVNMGNFPLSYEPQQPQPIAYFPQTGLYYYIPFYGEGEHNLYY